MDDLTVNDTVSPKIAAIRAFGAAGYALIPLNGKTPGIRDWVKTPAGRYGETELAQVDYGVVLGPTDLVIDVDPRNFAPPGNPLERLEAVTGPIGKTFIVGTGGGGRHIYLKKPAGLKIVSKLKGFSGLDFRSYGAQVVGPGSVHATGKQYEITAGRVDEIADAPAALLALLERAAEPPVSVGTGGYINDAETQGRYASYLKDLAPTSGSYVVACKGRDLGLSPETTHELMVEVWNPRRITPRTSEELRTRVEHAYRYAKGAVGAQNPAADFAPVPEEPRLVEATKISWVLNQSQKPVKCLQNCMNYLRIPGGGLANVFAYNDFTGRVEFANPAPWHRGKLPVARGVGDHDMQLLRGYLATVRGYEASISDLVDAITNVAHHARFHPVREYLNSLTWDGVKRLDTWLRDYAGAQDEGQPEYLAAVSRKTICAAVMRVMQPGVEFQHVLVLEGAQDVGKSSIVKILGGPWASDAPVDPHSRDTVDAMQGRWIIEMAELEVLRKSEADALKAFITRPTDRARLAYGHSTGEFPRQSIFIATKNPGGDGTYLKDDTGNRRWWPVRCEPTVNKETGLAQVDFKGLKLVRDQLFAEAVALMKRTPGEKLFMETPALKVQAKVVVGQRRASHSWSEGIQLWLERLDAKPETRRDFLTAREVFIEAIGGAEEKFGRWASLSIASVLRDLGWRYGARRFGKIVRWGWMRGEAMAQEKALAEFVESL